MQIPADIIKTGFSLADQYMDLRGLAAYSGMSVSALRHHIRANSLPVFNVAGKKGSIGKILVKRSEFDRWMETTWRRDQNDIADIVDDVMAALDD